MLHPALHFFHFLFKFACFAGSALVRGQVVGIVVVGMFAKAQQAAAKSNQQHRYHNGRDCIVDCVRSYSNKCPAAQKLLSTIGQITLSYIT